MFDASSLVIMLGAVLVCLAFLSSTMQPLTSIELRIGLRSCDEEIKMGKQVV